jgi:hypothetical protein
MIHDSHSHTHFHFSLPISFLKPAIDFPSDSVVLSNEVAGYKDGKMVDLTRVKITDDIEILK